VTVQREIVVVCGTDGSYARPLSVMLRSAVDNLAQDCSLLAYVLYSEVSEEDRDRVRRSISDTRCTIRWISVDTSTIAGVPLWGRMPVSTYFKLFLTDLLPVEVTRAVWLDCDILVCGDLAELWNTELGGYEAAAVQDQLVPLVSSRGGVARHRNLGIAADSKYFNAGVMVIDVAAWRTRHVTTKALDYLKRQWKSVERGACGQMVGAAPAVELQRQSSIQSQARRPREPHDSSLCRNAEAMDIPHTRS
jgi:lipopolysaccharide biosynthesis glycosyltransferase